MTGQSWDDRLESVAFDVEPVDAVVNRAFEAKWESAPSPTPQQGSRRPPGRANSSICVGLLVPAYPRA